MAKLSERVNKPDNLGDFVIKNNAVTVNYTIPEGYVLKSNVGYSYEAFRLAGWSDQDLITYGHLVKYSDNTNTLITQEKQNMAQFNTTNTLRTLNLSLIDLSSELKGEKKVVYEQANVRTEYTDEQTIQNLLATGDVLSSLQLHNEKVRSKTLDSQYKGSAREVFLEEIDHLGDSRLKWEVIRVG